MILGAQTEDLHGTALLLHSPDLVDWDLLGPIAGGPDDPLGYMWECPDLIRLAGRDVLVISPQLDHGDSAPTRWEDVSLYAIGALAGDPPRFERTSEYLRMDFGPDFYAPQSFVAEDGRTIMVGWMGMPDHDGQPSLAEKHPTAANGWVHCLTVPRELTLNADVLVQRPVSELASLHGDPVQMSGVDLPANTSLVVDPAPGPALDLELTATCAPGGTLTVRLREGDAGRAVLLTLNPHAGTATLDRTRLGSGEGGSFTGTFRPGDQVDARILLDHSSIEVFVDGGRLAMSARIYPMDGDDVLAIDASGASASVSLTAWPMSSS
jgi:beta-fructofuranosidase